MFRLDPLWRWLLGAVLALPASLTIWWWWLREPLIEGLAQALGWFSPWLWPDAVLGLGRQGDLGLLITFIPPLTEPPSLFMALPLSFNRATVIFPLFWGLTLATPGRGLFRRLLVGTALLVPVTLLIAVLAAQFQLVLYRTHLPMLTDLPPSDFALVLPDGPLVRLLSGLGRQLAVLVLPIGAPLLLWLSLHGAFIRRVISGGLLDGYLSRPAAGASTALPEDSEAGGRSLLTVIVLMVLIAGCNPQQAQYRSALQRLFQNDAVGAATLLNSLAENGHAPAQFRLGLLYRLGLGVAADRRLAVYWLEKAARQHEVGAQYYLADAYRRGDGIPRAPELAFQGFRTLAERGYAPAQYRLALAYMAGEGIARDEKAAVRWLEQAATGGHLGAVRRLAQAYRNGELGLPQDLKAAQDWEQKTQAARF